MKKVLDLLDINMNLDDLEDIENSIRKTSNKKKSNKKRKNYP